MSSQKSTIVRIQMTAIRAAFWALERVAPGLGSRWAERLWLTIPRYRGKPRPDTAPPGEAFTLLVDGRRVVGTVWGDGPTVYLVHGWGGRAAQLHPFVEPLLAAGFRVVAFDALGHGASEPGALGPHRTTIPEIADALTATVTAHGPAHAVIAHSGGCLVTFWALRGGLRPDRLVFLAPMAQPTPYTRMFAARLGFGERIRQRMTDRVATRVGAPWTDFDVPANAGRQTIPLLTVHDRDDRETRHADSVALAATWPGARLVTVTGLGHWRLLRDPAVIRAAVEFTAPRPTRAAG